MKYSNLAIMLFATCIFSACSKDSATVSEYSALTKQQSAVGQFNMLGRNNARLAAGFSQSISRDTANSMIQSYLTSVGYPGVDTAVRAMSFDADTLRAYLQDPEIVTVKFMFAHKQEYITGGNSGVPNGLNPEALTLIIAGQNDADEYILNGRNGVYDNMCACPNICPGSTSPYIQ